jgi:hypothetical protein
MALPSPTVPWIALVGLPASAPTPTPSDEWK